MSKARVLAVIPARGGSRGLPGKNIRPFAGKPLIAHSIEFAKRCDRIARCIVSTDSEEIAHIARDYGADVPFLRPAELATDSTPTMPVLKHALETIERTDGVRYDSLLLLEPTSPARALGDVSRAMELLDSDAEAAGVIAVSQPTFNPFWVGVTMGSGGTIAPAFDTKTTYTRRQDVPPFFRINGNLYLWRREYILSHSGAGWYERRHLGLEIPEGRAFSIDDLHEFRLAELMVERGLVDLVG
jgi:N-acylneuraminate cytidylyltransferase